MPRPKALASESARKSRSSHNRPDGLRLRSQKRITLNPEPDARTSPLEFLVKLGILRFSPRGPGPRLGALCARQRAWARWGSAQQRFWRRQRKPSDVGRGRSPHARALDPRGDRRAGTLCRGPPSPGAPRRSPDTPRRSPALSRRLVDAPQALPGAPGRSPGAPRRCPGAPRRSPGVLRRSQTLSRRSPALPGALQALGKRSPGAPRRSPGAAQALPRRSQALAGAPQAL